ncbi:hypothetical protein [Brevundimonas faecalis]|uniref:Uncharacterized protein YjbI with pentapeptide repeats n=1 Tax=Brevundimonas faecalis TaxID=947378 RepID=A0ABV2RET2_9CAUL
MTQTRGKTLTGDVELDGVTFVDCRFEGAQLIFRGGTPPNFQNCRFDRTRFAFLDQAANTLQLVRAMAQPQSNMRGVVLGLIPELTQ